MKLYSYDHCPYCVKARMIFGLKNIPIEVKTLLNDDEETPISMIGKKMLPILQKENGDFLPESIDIISYCDQLSKFGEPIVGESKNDERLTSWLSQARNYHYALAMPRWVKMGLKEFATESAIEYFTKKKVNSIGPFKESMDKTSELIEMAQEHLPELEEIIIGAPYFWGESLSIDDFHVFASLRCLTTTNGIRFPEKIEKYMNSLSQSSKVPLHWDKAVGVVSYE